MVSTIVLTYVEKKERRRTQHFTGDISTFPLTTG